MWQLANLTRRGVAIGLRDWAKRRKDRNPIGSAVEPLERQVGEGGAKHWGELEAVAGEAGGEDDVCVRRVAVDDEVLVGRHRVEADRVVGDAMRDAGQMGGEEIGQSLLLV